MYKTHEVAKPEARKAVLEFLRKGLHRTDAARCAGISFETFCQWMKTAEFSEGVKKAEADSRQVLVDRIKAAADDPRHWTAAAWLLERRSPNKFAKRERLEVKQLAPEKLTDEQLAVELEKALAALRKS